MGIMCKFCRYKKEMEQLSWFRERHGREKWVCEHKDEKICYFHIRTIFKHIENSGFSTRINPREISKGVIIYDDMHFFGGEKHLTSIYPGDPKRECFDNDKYMKIEKDEQGRQYLHIMGVDGGGYDVCTFKLYFKNDQDLINFFRR